MKTIQMTLDDKLVKAVDKVVNKLHTTRSAFTRLALREALGKVYINKLEHKHQKGYELHPVGDSEFSIWDDEQEWID